MKSDQTVLEHVRATALQMLARPLMYASNAESFEFQVFLMLECLAFGFSTDASRDARLRDMWLKFAHTKFDFPQTNYPSFAEDATPVKLAEAIIEFWDLACKEGLLPPKNDDFFAARIPYKDLYQAKIAVEAKLDVCLVRTRTLQEDLERANYRLHQLEAEHQADLNALETVKASYAGSRDELKKDVERLEREKEELKRQLNIKTGEYRKIREEMHLNFAAHQEDLRKMVSLHEQVQVLQDKLQRAKNSRNGTSAKRRSSKAGSKKGTV